MYDALEAILVAWVVFAFLPERPTRSQGGTDGSNPLSSSGESGADLIFRGRMPSMCKCRRGCAALSRTGRAGKPLSIGLMTVGTVLVFFGLYAGSGSR
jgi:hypothetical protein